MKTITEFLLNQLQNNLGYYSSLFIIVIIWLRQHLITRRTSHNEKIIKSLFNNNIVVKSIDEKGKIELENNYSGKRKMKKHSISVGKEKHPTFP